MIKKEFRVENEYIYNRTGPIHWIVSHLVRYPLLPLVILASAIFNNFLASYVQVFIGRAFDLLREPGWETAVLLTIALSAFGAVVGQNILGLLRNFTNEVIAQRVERDARDELYISLLGKSQTFHGRQRIGDIMARPPTMCALLMACLAPALCSSQTPSWASLPLLC